MGVTREHKVSIDKLEVPHEELYTFIPENFFRREQGERSDEVLYST